MGKETGLLEKENRLILFNYKAVTLEGEPDEFCAESGSLKKARAAERENGAEKSM